MAPERACSGCESGRKYRYFLFTLEAVMSKKKRKLKERLLDLVASPSGGTEESVAPAPAPDPPAEEVVAEPAEDCRRCPSCGHDGVGLGRLGTTTHYRCRGCSLQWSCPT